MQKELLEPAVKGTLNVLHAARDCGVNRVVLVSSKAAMVPNPNWPGDKIVEDGCWADLEQLEKLQVLTKHRKCQFKPHTKADLSSHC
jgi:nucleoside-diphosphate-sugar epimerase